MAEKKCQNCHGDGLKCELCGALVHNTESKMFYIEKMGVYSHGVYWIGTDLEKGKKKADDFATNDKDDYHDWELNSYDIKTQQSEKVYAGLRNCGQYEI